MLSRAASRGLGHKSRAIGLHDIEVALFHVYLDKPMACHPPREMKRPGWLWKVKKALYGTRKASQLFQGAVRDMYLAEGWQEIKVVCCVFYHARYDAVSVHHGDDFITEAEPSDLDRFDEMISSVFKTKKGPRIGKGYDTHGDVLNRTLLFDERFGFALLPDARHITRLARTTGVEEAKPAPTPASKATGKTDRHAQDRLNGEAAFLARSANGTLTYFSADRWDVQFASLQIGQDAHDPRVITWLRTKRVARYLIGTSDWAIVFFWQAKPTCITVPCDGDWAGDI